MKVKTDNFKQTSSIIFRLKMIMVCIAVFILFCIIALYLSSLSYLRGLQDLNSANNLLNLNSQIIESLNTSEKFLDEIGHNTEVRDLKYAYSENQKVISSLIQESITQIQIYPEEARALYDVIEFLKQSDAQYITIFSKLILNPLKNNKKTNELMADILVAKQLTMDSKEVLRNVQISIKKKNDEKFAIVFRDRFKPLAVTVTLSVLLFAFVITFGFKISKKLGQSISNLLSATELVAQGNLNNQVKIFAPDEIGRLTDAFNKMILSLKAGQDRLKQAIDRTNRLQKITVLFSEALTLEQVYEIIFKQAFEVLVAKAASVVLISEDKNHLEVKRVEGYDAAKFLKWKKFPLLADVPSAQAIRCKEPLYMGLEELKKFSGLNFEELSKKTVSSIACLPLVINGEAIGSINLHFGYDKKFDPEEKDFMMALARQCAQAIYRSQLYDNAKKAIEARDEFLSIASHELRTPLTPLKLQVQRVIRLFKLGRLDSLSPDRLKLITESFERQINRFSALVDNLLDVSRINTGQLTLKNNFHSLKEIIAGVLDQYSEQLSDTNSPIDLVVEKDSVGYWDKVRIEQVFTNVLNNAAKYAPGKPIHITLSNNNHTAKILIRDEGPGIAPEIQDRIFNRFERGVSLENEGGLGLGLFISKQIIEAHGGKIYIESSSNLGTVFAIELPEEGKSLHESIPV